MDFPQSGQGPGKEYSRLIRFALTLCILCIMGGCSAKHVETTPLFRLPYRQLQASPKNGRKPKPSPRDTGNSTMRPS